MHTIQDIEKIDLTKLAKSDIVKIRNDLSMSFYHTKHNETSSDGRNLKDIIGNQLTRFNDYLLDKHLNF